MKKKDLTLKEQEIWKWVKKKLREQKLIGYDISIVKRLPVKGGKKYFAYSIGIKKIALHRDVLKLPRWKALEILIHEIMHKKLWSTDEDYVQFETLRLIRIMKEKSQKEKA